MKLVLELDENQIHHLKSCLFAGEMEAWDYRHDLMQLGKDDKVEIWTRILTRRKELCNIINSAIEEQDCMGSFGEDG